MQELEIKKLEDYLIAKNKSVVNKPTKNISSSIFLTPVI